jgi:ribosomal protein L35
VRFVLGTIPFEEQKEIITPEIKQVLKKIGVKNYDLSHFKARRFHLISKKKLKQIRFLLNASVVPAGEFKPLNGDTKKMQGKVLVIKGL